MTDDCRKENHVMDWDNGRVIVHENNRHHSWIKEAFEILKRSPRTMIRGEGAYVLSHTWSTILEGRSGPTAGGVTLTRDPE